MTPHWQFDEDDQAQWRWKRVDEAQGEIESHAAFPKEIDCIIDAVRYAVQRRRTSAN